MGQCVYVGDDGKQVKVREMRSEEWMTPAGAGRILAEGHLLNTTVGLWFYESDLRDKAKLRERLLALVEQVTAPDFLPQYAGPVSLDVTTGSRRRKRVRRRKPSR